MAKSSSQQHATRLLQDSWVTVVAVAEPPTRCHATPAHPACTLRRPQLNMLHIVSTYTQDTRDVDVTGGPFIRRGA